MYGDYNVIACNITYYVHAFIESDNIKHAIQSMAINSPILIINLFNILWKMFPETLLGFSNFDFNAAQG